MTVENLQSNVPLVKPDGVMTVQTEIAMQKLVEKVRELEARVAALESP